VTIPGTDHLAAVVSLNLGRFGAVVMASTAENHCGKDKQGQSKYDPFHSIISF
jgi:hypothetical protein